MRAQYPFLSAIFLVAVSHLAPAQQVKTSGSNVPHGSEVPPLLIKSFNPATILVGAASTLTFTLTNLQGFSMIGLGFMDPLLTGLTYGAQSGSCGGGTITVTPPNLLTLTGATLPGSGSCTFSVVVNGNAAGMYINMTSPVISSGGPGSPATANLTVIAPPTIAKMFSPSTIVAGATSALIFTITNPAANPVALTGVAFSDPLPAGLSIPALNGLTNTCSGTVTLTANSIALAPSTLAAGGSCTISVNVTGFVRGAYPNTTTAVNSTNGGTGPTASATLNISPLADPFQVRYASNLNIGDSFVNITNTGASTTASAAGNLCVNVYTFDQSEELLSCCTCFVTPNGLQSISVKHSLISNNLTPEIPNSVVIKLLATSGGSNGASCNASSPTFATLGSGMRAWGTSLHAVPTTPVTYGITETPFLFSDLSQGELNHLTSFCGFIQSNASGFGICNGCNVGGLGAATVR